MSMFYQWLSYIRDSLQDVLDFIMTYWLTAVMFGLAIIDLVINAIKLKRNVE